MTRDDGKSLSKSIPNHRATKTSECDERLIDLIGQVGTGDKSAFNELYLLVSGRLFAAARNILRDNLRAEDALQEAFLRIWRFSGRFDAARGNPMAWMATIARNAALDIVKSKHASSDLALLDNLEFATQPLDPPDIKLDRCLQSLAPEQANAIKLMYVYGLTHVELALILKVPLGTAKSWVTRGIERLRLSMKDV